MKEGGSLDANELTASTPRRALGLGRVPHEQLRQHLGDRSGTRPAGQACTHPRTQDTLFPHLNSPPEAPSRRDWHPPHWSHGSEYDGGFNITTPTTSRPSLDRCFPVSSWLFSSSSSHSHARQTSWPPCAVLPSAGQRRPQAPQVQKKDLKINKLVCLVFCAVTAAGALPSSRRLLLPRNTKDLTGAMATPSLSLRKRHENCGCHGRCCQ